MNWDQVEGNWDQMKGKIRETWGKLTDDDLTVIKGKQQVLSGKIQERYGFAKEAAEKEIEKFLKQAKKAEVDSRSASSKEHKSSCC